MISFRIFLPTCWRSLRSLMTPCRRTRTGCALAGTSPRAAWWASWSRRPSSSARSVHTAVRASTVSLNSGVGALSAGLNVQPVPLHDDTTCRGMQGMEGFDICRLPQLSGRREGPSSLWYSGFHCLSSQGGGKALHHCSILVFTARSLAGQQFHSIISI